MVKNDRMSKKKFVNDSVFIPLQGAYKQVSKFERKFLTNDKNVFLSKCISDNQHNLFYLAS